MAVPSDPNKRTVILYSAGMDSTILALYARHTHIEPLLLQVALGAPYERAEMAMGAYFADRHSFERRVIVCETIAGRNGNIPTKGKELVRGRNSFLAHVAANYGRDIWIGRWADELQNPNVDFDYDPKFFQKTSAYLSRAFNEKVTVRNPMLHLTKKPLTKVRALGHAIETFWGIDLYGFRRRTFSCYAPKNIGSPKNGDIFAPCRACSACFSKAVSMITLGELDVAGDELDKDSTLYTLGDNAYKEDCTTLTSSAGEKIWRGVFNDYVRKDSSVLPRSRQEEILNAVFNALKFLVSVRQASRAEKKKIKELGKALKIGRP